jgi:DNA-directed RNA polymerase subunit RPC12/RpoP
MKRICQGCGKWFETQDVTATRCSDCKLKLMQSTFKFDSKTSRVKTEIALLKFLKCGVLFIFIGFIYLVVRFCL